MLTEDLLKLTEEVVNVSKIENIKISTAESCTGGELSGLITLIPGASKVYEYGFITYSNEAKITELNVSRNTLRNYGAVSNQAAMEMANGALNKSKSDIAIAITGIAGPGGGSLVKPVGTVFIAMSKNTKKIVNMYFFNGNREKIRHQACLKALEILLQELSLSKH